MLTPISLSLYPGTPLAITYRQDSLRTPDSAICGLLMVRDLLESARIGPVFERADILMGFRRFHGRPFGW